MEKRSRSVARVHKLSAAGVGKSERHNERKNENYGNINVVPERSPYNVSFKSPGELSYNEYFDELIKQGKISTRGLKDDATLFDEMIIDVNTDYFEQHGGYDYAKKFYQEAYKFCCELYGEELIVSAVMHADEINTSVSDRMEKDVYHYHLHVVAIPTVIKEIKWSARCKDEKLRGTTKEIIRQVSHSKKWKNTEPLLDDFRNPVLNKSGKPVLAKSYSILQDKLFDHMRNAGFEGFDRGERGSTAEHLSTLEFQIKKDKERLARVSELTAQEKMLLEETKVEYEQHQDIAMCRYDIDHTGKKGLLGRYTLTEEEYEKLTDLAKEGVTSRGEVSRLCKELSKTERYNVDLKYEKADIYRAYRQLEKNYNELYARFRQLQDFCRPFLEAMKRFPAQVRAFLAKLVPAKEPTPEPQPTPVKTGQERNTRRRQDDWER